jgi:catalase
MFLLVAFAASVALTPAALADDIGVPEQIVGVMNQLWGSHKGVRANHAKGVVLEGRFTPSKDGAILSSAPLFTEPSVPVTVRFSDSTGVPNIPDSDENADPRGMSIKFRLPSDAEMDIVANSLKFFPVANGEDFRDMLQALLDSPPSASKPTKADAFFASHPRALLAFASARTPVSFAREIYNGLNAFVFVDRNGARQPFRFQIAPEEGSAYVDKGQRNAPDWLMKEVGARVSRAPIRFQLKAQLAARGDLIADATQPWPGDRKLVDLGLITLDRLIPENPQLGFLPLNLVSGIEPSEDLLIATRNDAYAISFAKRLE